MSFKFQVNVVVYPVANLVVFPGTASLESLNVTVDAPLPVPFLAEATVPAAPAAEVVPGVNVVLPFVTAESLSVPATVKAALISAEPAPLRVVLNYCP